MSSLCPSIHRDPYLGSLFPQSNTEILPLLMETNVPEWENFQTQSQESPAPLPAHNRNRFYRLDPACHKVGSGSKSGIGSRKSTLVRGYSHLVHAVFSYAKSSFLTVMCEKITLPGVSELLDPARLSPSCLEKRLVAKVTRSSPKPQMCLRRHIHSFNWENKALSAFIMSSWRPLFNPWIVRLFPFHVLITRTPRYPRS